MNVRGKGIKIFAGNSLPGLASSIAKELGIQTGLCEVGKFADGECSVSIGESVRGMDCFIIQSTCAPVNDNLMELLIMADALHRASASRITAVIPYYGYARQDRKAKSRDPISAKLVADMISVSGIDRIMTMDLHAPQIQGFFNMPLDHLVGSPVLAKYFRDMVNEDRENFVCLSPDVGSVGRVRSFTHNLFDCPISIVDKRRQRANQCQVMNLIGDVKGKKVLIVDDVVDTAGTLCNAAEAAMQHGASEVYAAATHAVLSGPACDRIMASPIKEMVLLDSVPVPPEKMISKFKILSTADYIANAITCVHEDLPLSPMIDRMFVEATDDETAKAGQY
ncbi:MAG: ribose-phosphate pyrophosphokinase [Ruminococcaceae bacterium]|nr:ribose-phosphate pyrophosphokinase [Oscillospiraceae bacterium]